MKDIHIRQNYLALSFYWMSSKDAIEDFPLEYKKCTKNEKKLYHIPPLIDKNVLKYEKDIRI